MIKAKIDTRDRLIVALDTSSLDEAMTMVDDLKEVVSFFKVGLELYCHAGTRLFDFIEETGVQVFFDGKFHDIPNTVAGAARNVTRRQVRMFNVHATGGRKMMEAAGQASAEAAREIGKPRPILIAVTVLTSLSEEELAGELSVSVPMTEHVIDLARLAKSAGLDGVVASAREARPIREALGEDFVIVTPGIRPAWSAKDDQSRIVTPSQALEDGADYLVVGRPITRAGDRKDAARRILEEMDQALS